ncbi:hypothetical protein [Brachybacterium sp. GPGPB12]|uniref:hypothetical protein n=1 Tax=Brachybacterium sp. GPGPB12 TaxID=3023517 RepID=UPI0031343F0D
MDVSRSAVAVQEAVAARIEPLTVPRNALDVLAQHTVSAAAMEDLQVDAWYDLVRSAHPYRASPRSAFDQTIDLLAGRYPSTDFSEPRPRLVHDRETGTLTARPGARRLAVTSGGTIPDRGLYPVHLVAAEGDSQPRRVGELDEEMVYESRRGDVITLGTSAWRIEEISASRVTVSPAFGLTGRIPFWHGDGDGRPASLGRAISAAQSELAALPAPRPTNASRGSASMTTRAPCRSTCSTSSSRSPARCRDRTSSSSSASSTSSGTGAWCRTARPGSGSLGRGPSPSAPGSRSATAWTAR